MTNSDPYPVVSEAHKPRVQGDFYPLQKVELIALRKARLINNTAFVYLVIRYQHPFGDRPVRIQTKEFSLEWGIPESSLYEAIATLKREKVIQIRTRELVIEWNSQQGMNSENPESILGSHNPFRDPRTGSEVPEKSASKTISGKGFEPRSSQTFKSFKPPEPSGCVENQEQEEETQSALPPLLQQAKAAGVNLNDSKLKQAIAAFPQRVPTALAALAEKPAGTVRSPTRFLESAIRENWHPETHINPVFNQWYKEARQQGCPIAGAQFKDGVQWVYSNHGERFRWEDLRSLSWEQLQQTLDAPPILDLSDTLAAIDCEIDRLGWTLEQTRSFLRRTYSKPHRELLTDDQLIDLLHLLKAQEREK
ncbi:MAG: hypothetical protein ACKO24_15955 [Leptolyngbyaceae cyanobacterium]